MHVELELVYEDESTERLALDIVADKQADFASGFLGASTPLARAIAGQAAGSVVPYQVGDVAEVRILSVAPAEGAATADAASRRRATLDEALARAEMTNEAIFALAAGSKWGDYDPSKIETPWKEPSAPKQDDDEDGSAKGGRGRK